MSNVVVQNVSAVIGGVTVDVIKLVVSFAVNSIPTAQCTIATGEPVRKNGALAEIPSFGTVIKIYPSPVPTFNMVLFEGYVEGVSAMHTSGATGITLICHQKAATDLAAGPTLTGYSPSYAFDLSSAIGFSKYRNITHYERTLAEQLEGSGDLMTGINSLLKLFNSFPFLGNVQSIPGTLKLFADASINYKSLARAMIRTGMTIFNGATCWDMLIAFANMFKFVVVPFHQRVNIFPSLKGIQTLGQDTISPYTLVAAKPTLLTNPSVSSIIVKGGPDSPPPGPRQSCLRPIIVETSTSGSGRTELVPLPTWLLDLHITNCNYNMDGQLQPMPSRHFTSKLEQTSFIPQDLTSTARAWGKAIIFDKLYHDNVMEIITSLPRAATMPGFNIEAILPGVVSNEEQQHFTGFLKELRFTYDAMGHSTKCTLFLSHTRKSGPDWLVIGRHPFLEL